MKKVDAGLIGQLWRTIFGDKTTVAPPKFVSLAPTATADESGVYSAAIRFAIRQRDILNIALTGPYGSGKSSVIEAFLAGYPRNKTLRLSLASFVPEAGTSVTKVDPKAIERSILQQILYGVEAHTLPFSRFKRIQTPTPWSLGTSLLLVTGSACAWYLISKQTDILSGSFFKPLDFSNWFNLTCLAIASALAWRTVHSVYKTSFGLSLKSISLKDVQIAPDAVNDTSILNRHLDEILYFFQSTNYDLVIIEDLDRFQNADIFVTLREINGLINSNHGIKRRVRFLYALRDDIFANKDRTKFFEFIIPVIPVINHSNSVDKVLERSHSLDLNDKLDNRFVRDVSRHLTDLRLIHNIFNEYLVYSENLEDVEGHLDPNKLLAVLIYKNVFPSDFAALHQQRGALATVLSRHDEYVSRAEGEIKEQISRINAELEVGEAQSLRDEAELRMVYGMAIARHIPWNYPNLRLPSGNVAVKDLAESPFLEEALSRSSVSVSDQHGRTTTVNYGDIETSVDPSRGFAERLVDVGNKSANFRQHAENQLRGLRNQLASVRTRKFHEIVRESSDLISDAFAGIRESVDLLRFLILEGYLDDTYYQYISLFHSGRLSHNDNRFLIQIRAYKTPSPDFPIDNVAEVVASMRREDFGHNYVLNRAVADHLLEQAGRYPDHVAAMTHFMAVHFDACEEFFRTYYASGAQVASLVATLANRWPEYPIVALKGPDRTTHAARILAFAPEKLLKNVGYANSDLANFISSNTRVVLNEGIQFDLNRLSPLGVRVSDVADIADSPDAYEFITRNGLYRLSVDNVDHIFRQLVGFKDSANLETQHFSTLLSASNAPLLARVAADFQTYVREILLTLPGNKHENCNAISLVLGHDEVDRDLLEAFLRKQTAIFPSFEGIPEDFRALALAEQKIEATWENCLAFMDCQAYGPELLTDYLRGAKTHAKLSRQQIPAGDHAAPLREFLLENDVLPLDVYRSYVRQLPTPFPNFPDADADAARIQVLIEERKILFTPETFESLDDVNLKVSFVAENFNKYATDEALFDIDDSFRAQLLNTKVTDAQKLKIVDDMAESYVAGNATVAAVVGAILYRSPRATSNYGSAFVRAIVVHSRPVSAQVSLLNNFHPALSDAEVRGVLANLPEPFRDIAEFGKFPRLEGSASNKVLATWLEERKIISSFANARFGGGLRINTFKKPN